MPLTRLDTFLIRLLYAMAALIVVFQVLNRDAVVSLLFMPRLWWCWRCGCRRRSGRWRCWMRWY